MGNRKIGRMLWAGMTILLVAACGHRDAELEYALQQAGEHRGELEQVLRHYRDNPRKLEAAKFLIRNMPYHHTYKGWQVDSLKALKKASILDGPITDSVISRWKDFDYTTLQRVEDIHTVPARMLVDNIDLAFEVWERRPWSRHYSFEDFCEYILPYRIEDEPAEDWRRTYYNRYAPVLDSLYQGTDVVEAAAVMADYLRKEKEFRMFVDFRLPHLGALWLLENRVGFCRENCDIAIYAMRALGIPVTFDFYRESPARNSQHFFNAIVDTTHLAVQFNYTDDYPTRPPTEDRPKAKVYRICYGIQQPKLPGLYGQQEVPAFFRQPFLRDVTLEYFPGTGVTVDLDPSAEGAGQKYQYLSIYTGQEYRPVDIARRRGSRASFEGVENGYFYFVTAMTDGEMHCTGHPFLLQGNSPHYLTPRWQDTTTVCLRRKYPLVFNLLENSEGARIEVAGRSDFSDARLVLEVPSPLEKNMFCLQLPEERAYRYLRYTAPPDRKIEIGELHAYGPDGGEMLRPVGMASSRPFRTKFSDRLKMIYDGVWHTYFLSEYDGEALTLDYGRPVKMGSIVYVPRNDDNYVRQGDRYELFCHDGSRGWVSLGRRQATADSITFSGVPENSLLILRDLTRGKEERPFYMRDGRQVFPGK